ncbi:sulfotransferase 1E1-like [Stomoxys calcitrans]|uniref:Sulfotransferase domain-containing protein n=1 Tax=Stomoxys calcitrans TaxID=35570 RepID=A0A1I8QCD2_STOCA|nr:sulfotransferase 1E1-like [Stomoxys calcitrans]XP_013110528.1 sulfotransferase 1E1-like [Stomoxys calcitrans]XP_059219338.1 sulfotransferase 1E1-like [Stomoxys calcitrans]XP_059219340.1 sulfotransferase 1E1-like [Stomoxys calcitrans]XP_059219341.1 sulfotransferase 1E1-like [Stomoxys calcitrans]XP_059219342.1 sulfotransferase 1E1-like [Stomoxys calcitrans]
MAESEVVQPKRFPTNLLPMKYWENRKCYYIPNAQEFLNKVHDVEVYDDDVWLVSLPKCGTTWMQELLWLVLNNYDFEAAKSEHLEKRSPFMEFHYIIHKDLKGAFKAIETTNRPRLIKSHLCLALLPAQIWNKKTKVIYVSRNPKDAFVSEYHFFRHMGFFSAHITLEEYLNNRMESECSSEQFDNMTEYYALRSEPWLYYTSYERMKTDLRSVIQDVCQFLNKPIDEETMQQMLKHLSFEEMKKNPTTNHLWEIEQARKMNQVPLEDFNFCRKGKVSGYKEEISTALAMKLDKWVQDKMKRYNTTMEDLLLLN